MLYAGPGYYLHLLILQLGQSPRPTQPPNPLG